MRTTQYLPPEKRLVQPTERSFQAHGTDPIGQIGIYAEETTINELAHIRSQHVEDLLKKMFDASKRAMSITALHNQPEYQGTWKEFYHELTENFVTHYPQSEEERSQKIGAFYSILSAFQEESHAMALIDPRAKGDIKYAYNRLVETLDKIVRSALATKYTNRNNESLMADISLPYHDFRSTPCSKKVIIEDIRQEIEQLKGLPFEHRQTPIDLFDAMQIFEYREKDWENGKYTPGRVYYDIIRYMTYAYPDVPVEMMMSEWDDEKQQPREVESKSGSMRIGSYYLACLFSHCGWILLPCSIFTHQLRTRGYRCTINDVADWYYTTLPTSIRSEHLIRLTPEFFKTTGEHDFDRPLEKLRQAISKEADELDDTMNNLKRKYPTRAEREALHKKEQGETKMKKDGSMEEGDFEVPRDADNDDDDDAKGHSVAKMKAEFLRKKKLRQQQQQKEQKEIQTDIQDPIDREDIPNNDSRTGLGDERFKKIENDLVELMKFLDDAQEEADKEHREKMKRKREKASNRNVYRKTSSIRQRVSSFLGISKR